MVLNDCGYPKPMRNLSPTQGPGRVLIVSFQGWSDAGAAATTASSHLASTIEVEPLHVIDCDGYVDMQMHRPVISIDDDGERNLEWPDSRLIGPIQRPGSDSSPDEIPEINRLRSIDGKPLPELFFFDGTEPAHLWQNYTDEVMDLIDTWDFDFVIMLGSMFSDAPHSRPIPITLVSDDPEVRSDYDAQKPNYEGPVGISTVIQQELLRAEIPSLSLWAQIPHYVHSSPSPKATLALLDRLEEILNVVIPRGSLLEDATEWESNINQLASQDSEMINYIEKLEEARDSVEGPAATGEAIAYELEKFLRKDRKDKNSNNYDRGTDENPDSDTQN